MPDKFSPAIRSQIMSKIKSSNTKIELVIFKALRKNKIFYQMHYKKVLGSPDICFPRKKIAVFIDGGFWHGYKFNQWKDRLSPFWQKKISKNIGRDKKTKKILRDDGWLVIRIWEHQIIKRPKSTIDNLIKKISKIK